MKSFGTAADFAMIRNSSPGGYCILNLSAIDTAQVVITQSGYLTVIVKIRKRSFTFTQAEAIDLLSAMKLNPPKYHMGDLSNNGED